MKWNTTNGLSLIKMSPSRQRVLGSWIRSVVIVVKHHEVMDGLFETVSGSRLFVQMDKGIRHDGDRTVESAVPTWRSM